MGFYYRSWLKGMGLPDDQFDGRPVIGICNTWSELTPCNAHFRRIAEHVRYGVLEAGGFPLEFPVSSLGEVTMRPTAMLFRNLAAMDVEEAHPRAPARRRRAAHGLRQDHARAPDGRRVDGLADHRRLRRPATQRSLPRRGDRLGHARDRDERAGSRGRARAGGVRAGRSGDEPQLRALHDDGHRVEHGVDRRSARRGAPAERRDPGRRLAARHARAPRGPANRRDGPRRLGALENPHARGIRERDPHARGNRRIDERRDPPARDRGPHRRESLARGFRRVEPRNPLPRELDAFRQVPDGGLLLRGRIARGAALPRRARDCCTRRR